MKTLKVLMVDDDREDYLITKELLKDVERNQAYNLEWVDDAVKGKEEILKAAHDVYLIDYRIGSDSGLDLIREVREGGFDAPLILLTGQSSPEIDEQAIIAGASDYLVKGGNHTGELLDRTIRYEISHAGNLRKIRQLNNSLEERVNERTMQLAETIDVLARANHQLKQTILQKEEVEQALKSSQKLYSAIARSFPSGFIGVLNSDYKFVFAEGTELQKNHHFNSQLIGTSFLTLFPERLREEASERLEKALKGDSAEFNFEVGDKTYSVNLDPLYNNLQEIRQMLIVLRDVTLQKRTEEQLRQALKKEVQLNELKSRFVSMASHEFRTPLGAILTSVSLIEQYVKPQPEDKTSKHFRRVHFSIKQLTDILNDFLSIDKLEQGKVQSIHEEFNLKELVGEIIEELEPTLKRGQKIDLRFSGEEVIIQDKKILQNVLTNLLSNASKYSAEEQATEVVIEVKDHEVKMVVCDHGIGIPEEDQPFLFTRFFRAKNTVNIQGTGLGLNIVQKYVEMLKGKISFNSKAQEGSTFIVQFAY